MATVIKAKFLKTIREEGLRLQTLFPEVRTLYKAGLCARIIARDLHQNKDFCRDVGFVWPANNQIYSEETLSTIVLCALKGNKDKRYQPVYNGLMPDEEEYALCSRQHLIHGTKTKSDVVERRGAFAPEQCVESVRALNKILGKKEWPYLEADYAWQLKGEGYSSSQIAQILNVELHDGKEARSPSGVESFFYRPETRKKYPRRKPVVNNRLKT